MDLLSILLKGGVLIYPIFLASLIGLAVTIERYMVLKKARREPPKFMIDLRMLIRDKDIDGAIKYCMGIRTPGSNIIRKGLKKFHLGHHRVREAIESAGKQEVLKLEKGLSILATISGVAPLLGFLGTVTGMIQAFMKIDEADTVSPKLLAGGIWEALITTAFGLAVGIIALIFYNYFVNSVNKIVGQMEIVSNEIADAVEEITTGKIVKQQDDNED